MRLLVYVDPSPRGEAALVLARPLARGADLVLLATREDLDLRPPLLEEASRGFAEASSRLASARPGPAENAIAEETGRGRVDLLVVPPAGRSALRRLIRGSRVATVVRRVPASVLVARSPARPPRRILAAIGGLGVAEPMARACALLARAYGAGITLLHVASEVDLPVRGPVPRGGAEGGLERVHALLATSRLAAGIRRREGLLVEEILAEARGGGQELIVLGSPEGEAQARRLRDETTERILLESGKSVLVVRTGFPAPARTGAAGERL